MSQGCAVENGRLLEEAKFPLYRLPREQRLALEATFQNLSHIPSALQDRDHVQRFSVGPVDDEIGINWKELHRFVREIFAPVTDAWTSG